jgi:alpha-galactosidase
MQPTLLLTDGAATPFAEGTVRVGRLELRTALRSEGSGIRLDWSVRIPGQRAMALRRIGLAIETRFDFGLEHGWQSWSVVRRCRPDDVRPERRQLPFWLRARDFTEAVVAGRAIVGDPFFVTEQGITGFLSARTHFGRVEASPAGDGLVAWALLDGIVLQPGEERQLEPVWLAAGDSGRLYSEYAALAGTEATRPDPPAGWCSWYQHYGAVTPDDVRRPIPAASAVGLDLVQIDDGYQAAIGEWLTPNPTWSEGTAAVANDIRAAGLRAGIWTAPFLVDERGRVLADHPDWAVTGDSGRPRRAMHNPSWGGGQAALDTTNGAVLDHLRHTFAALTAEGFDYHKIDFLAAAAFPGRRHDPTKTRAEAYRAGLDAIRDGIGPDAFLLGCGAPLLASVGLVDAMRVSPDVAPRWSPPRDHSGMGESAPSAHNAILTSALRAPLHRRWWINDVDCLLLRPVNTALEPWQRLAVAASVAGGGGFTMVSDEVSTYGDEEWSLLAAVLDTGRTADGPLDLLDPFAPVLTVQSPSTTLEIDVDGLAAAAPHHTAPDPAVLMDAGPVVLRRRPG